MDQSESAEAHQISRLLNERDDLRVELETLTHAHADALDALSLVTTARDELHAENQQLRKLLSMFDESGGLSPELDQLLPVTVTLTPEKRI